MGRWYYGPLAMRVDADVWWTILTRLTIDVCAIAGVVLLAVGLTTSVHSRGRHPGLGIHVIWLWGLGTVGYLLVFFNLNHEPYIGEALDSVVAQDVDGLEIIVVDDGSSDDTAVLGLLPGASENGPLCRFL